jgi:hypothetical protein
VNVNARLTITWVAALAVAMLAAGCGGGDEGVDTTITVSSLSKPQFIKKTDVICYAAKTKMLAELSAYQREHPNLPRSNPGTEAVTTILVPSLEGQLVKLRELGAPAGDVQQIEAMWVGLERSGRQIEEQGISANPAVRHAFLPNGQRIYAYGMHGCAYGR